MKKINWKKYLTLENVLLAALVIYVAVDLYFRLFCGT
jgi:hypothetical protein